MAHAHSLGVHRPVALPYLVREGLLPPEPKSHLYQWIVYAVHDGHRQVEEQVLFTIDTVVWSQGSFIRNVYRFSNEGENVVQALITSFPHAHCAARIKSSSDHQDALASNIDRKALSLSSSRHAPAHNKVHRLELESLSPNASRALVVLLKTKAHVHFIGGASHVVDLPFEIERAFPTAHGLLLQRKAVSRPSPRTTIAVPAPPPNSFRSSQAFSTQASSQSPLAKHGRQQADRTAPSKDVDVLASLYESISKSTSVPVDEEPASLFSLSDPLMEMCMVTSARQHRRLRLSGRNRPDPAVEFEALDPVEKVVYVSSGDEFLNLNMKVESRPILLLTWNQELQTLTLWHGWHVEEMSLASLVAKRKEQRAAKARRRSSFISVAMGTGTTTPAPRTRDHNRESFMGNSRLPGDAQTTTKKPSRQEEEAVMASQMDPDFPTQFTNKDTRRISNMNTEARTAQNPSIASFASTATRRNTSFGGNLERRSYGLRRSRGSTPGSVFSRSIGAEDDDTMDLDSDAGMESEESIDAVVRFVRAAHEAVAAEKVFGDTGVDYQKELIVRKLHSIHLRDQQSTVDDFKAAVLHHPRQRYAEDSEQISVLIHSRESKAVVRLAFVIKQRPLWPTKATSPWIAVPCSVREESIGTCEDLIRLEDGAATAVMLAGHGLLSATGAGTITPLPSAPRYRMFGPSDELLFDAGEARDVGKNRELELPQGSLHFAHAGISGSYDEVDASGTHHRRQIRLVPSDDLVTRLLEVCEAVLPPDFSSLTKTLWCSARAQIANHTEILNGTSANPDLVALIAAIDCLVFPLLDNKARAAVAISKVAANKRKSEVNRAMKHDALKTRLFATSPWAWTLGKRSPNTPATMSPKVKRRSLDLDDQLLFIAARVAEDISSDTSLKRAFEHPLENATLNATNLLLGLHIYREEQKLNFLAHSHGTVDYMALIITQLGLWLGLPPWSPETSPYYRFECVGLERYAYVKSSLNPPPDMRLMDEPVGVFQWYEFAIENKSTERYPLLSTIARLDASEMLADSFVQRTDQLTPRIAAVAGVLSDTNALTASAIVIADAMVTHKIDLELLESLPDGVAIPLKEALARCERDPPTACSNALLELIGREDLEQSHQLVCNTKQIFNVPHVSRSMQSVCNALDQAPAVAKTKEASRHAVSQLIFNEDRRLVDAVTLMHYNNPQTVECPKQPDWSDAQHFDVQRRIMQFAITRMIALPPGDGMIHYDSQTPLLTEKYHLAGFNSACIVQPMGHTLTADRTGFTEEKVNWAYFHAGVSAGLRISRNTSGIDTSWIAFNKPFEPTHRHAGLLLALGLNGQLRSLAKWLAFKYLTKKHDMTSVGLLLGLSASYMGSMDSLITRMLSVHITRMLPPGAAELNISPLTQTAGLMGIGLLYHGTQHRRMSEIMLSEIEHLEVEDPDSGPDQLRDESYRLAAGFALGFINLGRGQDLKGLHGMRLLERLLAVAIGPRPVSVTHVFDRATAGAIVATTLIYMKSRDQALATKIDIPSAEAQFEHVRPDMLLLRAMAKHLILWDTIQANSDPNKSWIQMNLPICYRSKYNPDPKPKGRGDIVRTTDVPFYNILTGLTMALSLRFAGSQNVHARDEICRVIDFLHALRDGGEHHYDAKLARATIRRCIDVCSVSAAMVMAGSGDLQTFRYLRRLHGRLDAETTFGSHLAAHLAIGLLFLAGGTYTLGTSDLAVASLICAFYPLYPMDIQDNRCHLQAFRHLWIFAAEPRCLVVEDIDTQRPIHMPLVLAMKDGTTRHIRSPCLLPELDDIATVSTNDPTYRRVTLDFVGNAAHLSSFRKDQRVYVRRCPVTEAHDSIFSASLAARNDAQSSQIVNQLWHTIFTLPAFRDIGRADIDLILAPDPHSSVYTASQGTVVDDRLALTKSASSNDRDALWSLRLIIGWAETLKDRGDNKLYWIGHEIIEMLKAHIERRTRVAAT